MTCADSLLKFIIPTFAFKAAGASGWRQTNFSNTDRYPTTDTLTTTYEISIDLGASFASYDQPDFIFISQLKRFYNATNANVTVRVQAAADSGFTVPDTQDFTFTGTGYGVFSQDFFGLVTLVTKRRYWRIRLLLASSLDSCNWGSVVLGKMFTLDRNPIYPIRAQILDTYCESQRNHKMLNMNFKGISPASKKAFSNEILQYEDLTPIVVYDPEDLVLMGLRVQRFYVANHIFNLARGGYNYDLELQLEELIGL